jgi:hypothetical protein
MILDKKELQNVIPQHVEDKLAIAELRFVGNYILNGGHATNAAAAANNRLTREAAAVYGSRLLKREKIQRVIRACRQQWFADIREECKEKAIKMLAVQAFFDPADIIDSSGNIKPNTLETERDGEYITLQGVDLNNIPKELRLCIEGIERKSSGPFTFSSIKLVNRHNALKMLNEYLGLFDKDPGDDQPRMTEETENRLAKIFNEK